MLQELHVLSSQPRHHTPDHQSTRLRGIHIQQAGNLAGDPHRPLCRCSDTAAYGHLFEEEDHNCYCAYT